MDSILTSTKKLLGIAEEDTSFDQDVIMHINSVLIVLNQLGVGPGEGFAITDSKDEWSDFLSDTTNLNLVKSYVYLKVRMLFDPPTGVQILDAVKSNIAELEWRICSIADKGGK